jgi:hypothetical protein
MQGRWCGRGGKQMARAVHVRIVAQQQLQQGHFKSWVVRSISGRIAAGGNDFQACGIELVSERSS